MDSHTPSLYIFDKQKLLIPHYMEATVPPDLRDAIYRARKAASVAFQGLKKVERFHAERYHRLCPADDIKHYHKHKISVDRLLECEVKSSSDPPLTMCPKIPLCVINFHIDKRAYESFQNRYELIRLGYLHGPFRQWRVLKRQVDYVFEKCEMDDHDKELSMNWWKGFQHEMVVWERRVNNLALPKWNDIVDDLAKLIEQRVDLQNEWECSF